MTWIIGNLYFHPSVKANLIAFFQSFQPHLINEDPLVVLEKAQLSGDISEELWPHDADVLTRLLFILLSTI